MRQRVCVCVCVRACGRACGRAHLCVRVCARVCLTLRILVAAATNALASFWSSGSTDPIRALAVFDLASWSATLSIWFDLKQAGRRCVCVCVCVCVVRVHVRMRARMCVCVSETELDSPSTFLDLRAFRVCSGRNQLCLHFTFPKRGLGAGDP